MTDALRKPSRTHAIGVDIGGSSIKTAVIELSRGELITERVVVPTPKPAAPDALTQAVAAAVEGVRRGVSEGQGAADGVTAGDFDVLPIGIAFPGVVKEGIVTFAFNLDQSWLGSDIGRLMKAAIGRRAVFLNDADAAGLAEMTYGAARPWRKKTVMMTTLGTGIGTALFTRGRLVPFTELGHIEINGEDAELSTSAAAKVRLGLDYPEWTKNLSRYYREIEKLLNPDVFIVGGGISKDHAEWLHMVEATVPVIPAQMFNDAGIIGAAVFGAHGFKSKARKRSRKAKKDKKNRRTGHR